MMTDAPDSAIRGAALTRPTSLKLGPGATRARDR